MQLADEQVAELSTLCGFDDDVVGQITVTSNRIRGLLTQIHPSLERVVGPHLDHPAVLGLLQRYTSPAAMKAAGTLRLGNRLIKLTPRMGRRLADEITQALGEQTVVVTGRTRPAPCFPGSLNNSPHSAVSGQNSRSRLNASWRLILFNPS